MEYKCVKTLIMDLYDDDCIFTEKEMVVEVGSIWCVDSEFNGNFMTTDDAVHLTSEQGWIEIYPDTLSEHFEEYAKEGKR